MGLAAIDWLGQELEIERTSAEVDADPKEPFHRMRLIGRAAAVSQATGAVLD